MIRFSGLKHYPDRYLIFSRGVIEVRQGSQHDDLRRFLHAGDAFPLGIHYASEFSGAFVAASLKQPGNVLNDRLHHVTDRIESPLVETLIPARVERGFNALGRLLSEDKKNAALEIARKGQDRRYGAGKRGRVILVDSVGGDEVFAKLAFPYQLDGRNYGSEYCLIHEYPWGRLL